ncbi:tetratricopeptide repeat protein [Sphingobacterium spiritivorum]|uniref:tetratricopeptide repeat protein n=1 Tax=Sphingobacterium spiritivorum TaxID=258 RepID=UPI003DA50DC8
MKLTFLNITLKNAKMGLATLALAFFALSASAQQKEQEHSNPNVRLGQKALLDGDFKSAATHLEKALPKEGSDPNVLYMLGYSQFHNGDFKKASDTFGKVVALDAKNGTAYYYKAKASNNLAVQTESKLSSASREQLLKTAIDDFSKAIAINSSDAKLYQNRAIAYRDLGILVGTSGAANYNKAAATDAYNKAISDYQKLLSFDSSRKDIQREVKKATVYRDNLK